jgi:hypothetical protein
LIPEPIARNHNIIAFKKTTTHWKWPCLIPKIFRLSILLKKNSPQDSLPRLTDTESMKAALLQYQKSLKAEFGDIIQKEVGSIKTIAEKGEGRV